MNERIQQIVAELPRLKSVDKVFREADERLASGDIAFLADLAGALMVEKRAAGGDETWQYGSVFDHLLRLFATTPGRLHVEQALRLVAMVAPESANFDRYVASMLASSHMPEDLSAAFTGGDPGASEELRASLVHELVLRGAAIAAIPSIHQWTRSAHWRDHPLGALPLELDAFETDSALPQYSSRGSASAMPYGRPGNDAPTTLRGASRLPSATEVTTEDFSSDAAAAVMNWVEESNGRFEARAFDLAEPVADAGLPDLLVELDLESLRGVDEQTPLTWSPVEPRRAWRVLFSAASSGGAYNYGHRGAYGRLYARRSIAALSGASGTAPSAGLEQRVQACRWFSFTADTTWFEQVAWDIGLVALSPDARHVTVLAATDTD